MKLALVQTNPIVGDLVNNSQNIIKYIDEAKEHGVELVVFPELSLIGYPPKDLLYNPDFVYQINVILNKIEQCTRGIKVI